MDESNFAALSVCSTFMSVALLIVAAILGGVLYDVKDRLRRLEGRTRALESAPPPLLAAVAVTPSGAVAPSGGASTAGAVAAGAVALSGAVGPSGEAATPVWTSRAPAAELARAPLDGGGQPQSAGEASIPGLIAQTEEVAAGLSRPELPLEAAGEVAGGEPSDAAGALEGSPDAAEAIRRAPGLATSPERSPDDLEAPRRPSDAAATPGRPSDDAATPGRPFDAAEALGRPFGAAGTPGRSPDAAETLGRPSDAAETLGRPSGAAATSGRSPDAAETLGRSPDAGRPAQATHSGAPQVPQSATEAPVEVRDIGEPRGDDPKAPRRGGLEQALGATVAVWGGAGALGLAAILLVQYGIQNAMLGPELRIGMGAAASLVLVIGGELAFKKLRAVGGGLVGAGIVGLYATFAAASALYHMIPPLFAGTLMVLTTLTAASLSIRHNLQIIAVVGLLGGFLTPLLIGVKSDSPVTLMSYLALLNVGVLVVSSWRLWPSLLLMAASLNFIAEMAWLLRGPRESNLIFLALCMVLALPTGIAALTGAGFLRLPAGPSATGWPARLREAAENPWAQATLHLSLLPVMVVIVTAAIWWRFPALTWAAQVPLLLVLFGAMASSASMARTLPVLAYVVVLFQQWLFLIIQGPTSDVARPYYALFGALFVLGMSALTVLRPERRLEPALAFVAALIQFLMAYTHTLDDKSALDEGPFVSWPVLAIGVALYFAALSTLAQWRHRASGQEGQAPALTVTALTGALFVVIAAPIAFDGPWLTMAWLACAAGLVALGQKLDTTATSSVGLVTLAVCAFRLLVPYDFSHLHGGHPVLNMILLLYSSAVVATSLIGWRLSRDRPWFQGLTSSVRVLALIFFMALITIEIRHFYHPDLQGRFDNAENLTYSIAWMLVGLGALGWGLIARSALSRWVSLTLVMGTSLKIFLYDLSYLDGLWRVASLSALGVILIAIASLYRLYVFPDPQEKTSPRDS